MENIRKFIETLANLIGSLSWPLVVIFLIYYFGKPLKGIISRMGEFSLKAGPTGLEASAKLQELRDKLPTVYAKTTSGSHVQVNRFLKSSTSGGGFKKTINLI